MPRIPDAEARIRALDPSRSFIVQAPAGSGKTELLIQRFLKLLRYVEYPEQILAMTFTRKAAGEMKARILLALKQAQDPTAPAEGHQRTTWDLARKALKRDQERGWRLLDNPARLRVQTLDSFSLALTRQMPLLSKTGGPPTIEENAQTLYEETAQRVLQLVESTKPIGECIRTILQHLDNSKSAFIKRVIQLLEKRDQWLIHFFDRKKLTPPNKEKFESTLAGLIETVLGEASALFPDSAGQQLAELAAYSAENIALQNPDDSRTCLRNMKQLPRPSVDYLNQWKALANLLLTKDGDFRKQVSKTIGFPPAKDGAVEKKMKEDFTHLLKILCEVNDLRECLHEIQSLPEPWFSDAEWDVLKSTLYLLPEIAAILRNVFFERGKTDFTEISLSALEALGTEDQPTNLLLYLDYKIQHILVDEYQDTSYKQYELLKNLTAGWEREDGRTLFIVGDPMQSIYRFRDAEVGLFLRTRDAGLKQGWKPESLTLKTNFRSQKKIVDWVNRCFATAFPRKNDQNLGAIAFSESEAHLPGAEEQGVVLHPLDDAKTSEEADRITGLVQTIREKHPEKTIAILVRNRSHLPRIIRVFQKESIPFKAEEIDPLTRRPAILDLLSLMEALQSPLDRVSWLSILRAPWCGLRLEDLHRLVWCDAATPVWALLHDHSRISRLSEDGRRRVKRFVSIIEPVLESLPAHDFRDVLEGCWIRLGGPACVDETTLQDVDVFFDEISRILEWVGATGLKNFSRRLETLYASPVIGEDHAVQIMTMHKAKGLEFDFVILPGLGRGTKSEEKRLVYWVPHGEDLLIAPIEEKGGRDSPVYNFLSRLDREKDRLENLRLLYVAATRARHQLHLFGHTSTKHDVTSPMKNSLLDKIWSHVGPEWERKLLQESQAVLPGAESEEADTRFHQLRRLRDEFEIPEPLPDIDTGPAAEMEEEETRPEFIWAGNQRRCLGNVVHRRLKDIADEGIEHWPHEKVDPLAPVLKSALQAEGLTPDQAGEQVAEAVRALKNLLQDEKGRWILKQHAEARSEYPLTGILNHRFAHKIIDRTFVDEEGVRWIIDYKTGEHQGTNLEKFFREEKERYRPQLDQYQELIRLTGETRPIKKALYYPLHQRLIEL